jgi:hypothetical protein
MPSAHKMLTAILSFDDRILQRLGALLTLITEWTGLTKLQMIMAVTVGYLAVGVFATKLDLSLRRIETVFVGAANDVRLGILILQSRTPLTCILQGLSAAFNSAAPLVYCPVNITKMQGASAIPLPAKAGSPLAA